MLKRQTLDAKVTWRTSSITARDVSIVFIQYQCIYLNVWKAFEPRQN